MRRIQSTAILAFVLVVSAGAWCSVTYSYTGNLFNQFGQGYGCPPVCNVEGSFTVAQALAPNLPEFTFLDPLSLSLTSGGVTVTLADATQSDVTVGTDGSGNIIYFLLFIYGVPGTARIVAQSSSVQVGTFDDMRYIDSNDTLGPIAGIIFDNPGTWSVTTNTPEPSCLILMTGGLLGVIRARRRHRT